MPMTKRKTATTAALLTLAFGAPCRADLPATDVGSLAEEALTMFPDGLAHDFGKVPRGIVARHTFRVVNTSKVPLEITALRWT